MRALVTAKKVHPLFERSESLADGALVLGARAGEAWAQEALFRRYAKVAFGLAWRLVPHEDPEDVAQEALVKALTSLHRLEAPQAFAAWLSTIVVRLATSRIRKRRLLERLGLGRNAQLDLEAIASGAGHPEAQAQLRQVYRFLGDFPAQERVALVLQRVEGLELTEIGARMGLSVATVKRRLASATRKLEEWNHG